MEKLLSSIDRPIVIHDMFALGKDSVAARVAQKPHKEQPAFWLHFGADCQRHDDQNAYERKVLAQQRELYRQITGKNPQVCGQLVVCIPVTSHNS